MVGLMRAFTLVYLPGDGWRIEVVVISRSGAQGASFGYYLGVGMAVVGAQGPFYSSSFVLDWWCFDTFVWLF
jgi:hypothetical protein